MVKDETKRIEGENQKVEDGKERVGGERERHGGEKEWIEGETKRAGGENKRMKKMRVTTNGVRVKKKGSPSVASHRQPNMYWSIVSKCLPHNCLTVVHFR